MANQTTNNSIGKTIGKIFGKSIVATLVLFAAMFFAAEKSFAQNGCISLLGQTSGNCKPTTTTTPPSNNLYYQSNGVYYGRVTAYPTHFQIQTNGSTIKTFANSCKPANSNGVAGLVCSFGQFDLNGRHIYSGWGYFFQNGYVYLAWTNENMGGYWRQINTGWYGFRP